MAIGSRRGPTSTHETLTDPGAGRRLRLEPGDRVGRYRIEQALGTGGMGTVYAATDPDLHRSVAIKVLHDRRGKKRPPEVLLREAQAMARFSHPNVVTVHDVGTHQGRLFVAMDWIRGPTLRSWMKGRAWDEILRAFLQAGHGLAAVHAAGMVHRDFKPANVMVHPGGRVVVMDFGLARTTEESDGSHRLVSAERTDDDALSRAGSVEGTPAYMAPEQHLAFDVDARADQFSYCVSVFEGLYGTRPFRARTVTELLVRIAEAEVVDVPRSKVPRRVHRALIRGLCELPGDRWPSMEALLDRLEPPARGRWMVWGAGAAALAAMGFAAAPSATSCDTRGDAVAALWSKSRRDAVFESVRSSPKPYAARMADKLDGALDEHVQALVRAHDQACATPIDDALLDRRTACLRQRTGALRAALETLEAFSGGPMQAMTVVERLPDARACLDPASLARALVLPADEAHRAQVEWARDAISEAATLEVAGDLQAARVEAEEALVLARDAHYPPVEAEALATWGSALDAQGEYAEAAGAFEAAFYLAHANHHDEIAVRSAVELVYIVGYRLQQREAADDWVRRARATLPRVEGAYAAKHRARLINNEATLAYGDGDYEAAAAGFEETAAIREAQWGPDDENVAAAHSNLGLALTRLGRFDEALEHHDLARRAWESILGLTHPMVAISVHNRAYVYESMKRYEDAAAEYERAVELRRRSQGPEHPSVGLSLNNLGTVRLEQGRAQDSLALHQEALALWQAAYGPHHRRVAEALDGIARAMLALGRLEEAHRFADRTALTLETVVGPDHPEHALALMTLARIQAAEGDAEAARSNLQHARDVLAEAWGPDHDEIREIDENLAGLPPS